MTIGSKLGKITAFLVLTTLAIGLGSALSWENPSPDEHIPEGAELNLTGEPDLSVDVYYREGEDEDWIDAGSAGEESSGVYTKNGVESNLGSVEGLELKANSSTNSEETEILTVTLDKGGPEITYAGENNYVKDDPEVEFDISDEYSDIEDIGASAGSTDGDVSVDNVDENCDGEGNCQANIEVDTSDLDNGDEFTLTVDAADQAGNENDNGGESFEIDDSYDGDESPDIFLEDNEDADTVMLNEDEEQDVMVDISEEDESTDIRAICSIDGDEIETTDYENPDDDDTEFQCEVDGDEYSGETVDFEVELCDEAGNCADEVSEEFTFDGENPEIMQLQHPEDISTFNSEFTLEYVASDDASGISRIKYTSDEDATYGNWIDVERDGDGEFTVQVDDIPLDSGSNTIYVRAQDNVGRLSSEREFDFEYYPDRAPEASLSVPDSLELRSNENASITVTVENTGEFFINGLEVSDSLGATEGFTVSDLDSGSSLQEELTVDASDQEVGRYNLTFQTENPDASATVDLTVRATAEQRQDINSTLQEQVTKMEDLEENVSKLGGLSDENQERLNSNVSEFTERVENAREAVQRGEYYRAESYLQNIDSKFSQASSTYEEVQEDYRQRMNSRYIMFALIGVVILGGGAAGFLLYREEELLDGIDFEGGSLPDVLPDDWEIDVPDSLPEIGVMTKAKGLLGNGEEEEEEEEVGYTFEDFA